MARLPYVDDPDVPPGVVPFVDDPSGSSPMLPAQPATARVPGMLPQNPGPPPALMHIGDETPLGRFAQPILPPPPAPMVQRAPTGVESQRDKTQGDLEHLQMEDKDPYGSPDNHPGFGGKLLHGLASFGNVAGAILAPGIERAIPGSKLNRMDRENTDLKNLETLSTDASTDNDRDATTGKTLAETAGLPQEQSDKHDLSEATTRHTNDEANAIEHPLPEYEIHDTQNGPLFVNKKTGAAQHLSVDGMPIGPKIQTKTVQLQVGGKPHQVLVNEQDGSPIKDLGESGVKPPVINNNAGATREFQETERGRGLLDKAEAQYRTAQQGANTLRDMVGMARQGNKMSAQMLPLEGALEITTAQGVKRINRTEVDQFAGGGSAFDQLAGKLGKLTAGQPIPENLFPDIMKLADAQEQSAYSTYKGAYDSANKRYGLKNEQPLTGPGGGAPGGAQVLVDAGVTYQIPADQVAAFKKDHPNAR